MKYPIFTILISLSFCCAAALDDIKQQIYDKNNSAAKQAIAAATWTTTEQSTLLQTAANASNEEIIDFLLKQKFPVDAVKDDGFDSTAFMYAAYVGNIAIMEKLFQAGADINRADKIGDPAINWAVFAGRLSAVQWLLQKQARIDQVGHGNALEIAMRRGFTSIVELLCHYQTCHMPDAETKQLIQYIDQGSSLTKPPTLTDLAKLDETGRPLIHRLVRLNRLDLLRQLATGADKNLLIETINLTDAIGFSPLMEASRDGNHHMVTWLLNNGGNYQQSGNKRALSLTALHLAALSGHQTIVAQLVNAGANIDAIDSDGNTAAMWAYFSGHAEVSKQLVKLGANVDIENNFGLKLPAQL